MKLKVTISTLDGRVLENVVLSPLSVREEYFKDCLEHFAEDIAETLEDYYRWELVPAVPR